jgi:hypothetical protein
MKSFDMASLLDNGPYTWDALPPNAMLIVATGVGDSPRLRTLQERKWKRLQGLGPWGAWTEVERCTLTVSNHVLKAPMVSALESIRS